MCVECISCDPVAFWCPASGCQSSVFFFPNTFSRPEVFWCFFFVRPVAESLLPSGGPIDRRRAARSDLVQSRLRSPKRRPSPATRLFKLETARSAQVHDSPSSGGRRRSAARSAVFRENLSPATPQPSCAVCGLPASRRHPDPVTAHHPIWQLAVCISRRESASRGSSVFQGGDVAEGEKVSRCTKW